MKVKNVCICFIILLGQSVLLNGMCFWIDKKVSVIQNNQLELIERNKMIAKDIEKFPVPMRYWEQISFQDDYGAYRVNGKHEGCDIFYNDNVAGVVPIISATDGVITNLGWLYLGGYRIGITSDNGVYYYYAHLDSYAKGLSVGKVVNSGELIGFMGSTGEGEEGTEGKFPVHLHFGIYLENRNENQISVNPYYFLQKFNEE